MQRIWSVGTDHPGELLLWRVGEWWYAFGEDGRIVRWLIRGVRSVPGLLGDFEPVHQSELDRLVQSLVRDGHRVALVEPVDRER